MIRFEQAEKRHASIVARCMRERDVDEIRAGWGKAPFPAIMEAMQKSYFSQVAFYGLEPLAIYGLATLNVLTATSQVWIFGTRHIDKHPIAFTRASVRVLRDLHKRARIITNLIDSGDARANRWLQWLGGKAVDPSYTAHDGRKFHQFILEGTCRQA